MNHLIRMISGCSAHLTITFYHHLKSYNSETQRFSIRSEPLYENPIKLWNPLHKSSLYSSQAGDITWFNTPYPIIPCEWSGQWWHYNGYESCHDVCMRNADCNTSFSLFSLFCLSLFLSVFQSVTSFLLACLSPSFSLHILNFCSISLLFLAQGALTSKALSVRAHQSESPQVSLSIERLRKKDTSLLLNLLTTLNFRAKLATLPLWA